MPPLPDFRERRRRWRRSPSHQGSLSRPSSSHSRSLSPISRSVPAREDRRSRTKYGSRNSSRSRSSSKSRTRFCETNEHLELPSSSRRETTNVSQSKCHQPVSETSIRPGRGSEDRDNSLRSVLGQSSRRSELVHLGTGQPPSGGVRSNDALLPQEDNLFMKSDDALTRRKGKSKVDDAKQTEGTSSVNIHHDSTAESHSLLTQSRTVMHKPPRNRTLRESVEAHLGSGKKITVGGDVNAKRKDSQSHAEDGVTSLPGSF